MLFFRYFSFAFAFFFLGFSSIEMEEDWEEEEGGDNFLFCNRESFMGEGVWGGIGFEVEGRGILANWISSKDLIASSWVMLRDDKFGLRFSFSSSFVWVMGFWLRRGKLWVLFFIFCFTSFTLVEG